MICEIADIVLPGTIWLEEIGAKSTYTYIHLSDQVLPDAGHASKRAKSDRKGARVPSGTFLSAPSKRCFFTEDARYGSSKDTVTAALHSSGQGLHKLRYFFDLRTVSLTVANVDKRTVVLSVETATKGKCTVQLKRRRTQQSKCSCRSTVLKFLGVWS